MPLMALEAAQLLVLCNAFCVREYAFLWLYLFVLVPPLDHFHCHLHER